MPEITAEEEYKKNYPLHHIARSLTNIEQAEKLLKNGNIDINAQDDKGYTALDRVGDKIENTLLLSHFDIKKAKSKMLSILLKNGAKLTDKTDIHAIFDLSSSHEDGSYTATVNKKTYFVQWNRQKFIMQIYMNILSDKDGKIREENHEYIDALSRDIDSTTHADNNQKRGKGRSRGYDPEPHPLNEKLRCFFCNLDANLQFIDNKGYTISTDAKTRIMYHIKKSYCKATQDPETQMKTLCKNIAQGLMSKNIGIKTDDEFINLLANKLYETSKDQLEAVHQDMQKARDAARSDLIGKICDIFLALISNIFNVSLDAASKAAAAQKNAVVATIEETFVDKMTTTSTSIDKQY